MAKKQKNVTGELDVAEGESWLSSFLGFFERQSMAGLPTLGEQEPEIDVLAVVGAAVVLRLQLDRLQALSAQKVEFQVDGQNIGEAPVTADRVAALLYTPAVAGCFDLDYVLIGASGAKVAEPRSLQPVKLHAIGNEPVVCVDAEMLFGQRPRRMKSTLVKLAAAGFSIVYLDSDRRNRIVEIRRSRDELGLPLGAILSLARAHAAFTSFSVDFRAVFFELALRRLRSAGAAVVALYAEAAPAFAAHLPGLTSLRPGAPVDPQALQRSAALWHKQRRAAPSALHWRVDQMTAPARACPDNSCEVVLDNRLARQQLFKAIDGARATVDLQFYIFRECNFTHELGVRLARAAQRGVSVRLLVDALWSNENFLGSWNGFLQDIRSLSNIAVLAADPVRISDNLDALKLRQRDHRKLAIVDGQIAFVSGRNAADEYYYDWREVPIADWTPAERIPWLDAHVRTEGPIVAEIQRSFNETWRRNGGEGKQRAVAKPKQRGNTLARLVIHEGTSDAHALAVYEALIAGAESHVYIVNDFPVLHDIALLLHDAVKRGVRVTFLTGNVLARRLDGSFFRGGRHRELFEYVTKSRFGDLADAGVRVVEFVSPKAINIVVAGGRVRPYVHAKIVTADGCFASIGSANLDVTASYWEREANLLLEDPVLVAGLEKKIESYARRGLRLDTGSAAWLRELPQRELVSRLWPDAVLS